MRGFSAGVLALMSALKVPRLVVLVEFPSLGTSGTRITNWPRDITFGGKTYAGAKTGTHPHTLAFEGVGENLDFETPSAVLKIGSVDGYWQSAALLDQLRGTSCVLQIVYHDGSALQSLPWTTTYTCDSETIDAGGIVIRLASVDAAQGTEIPRRSTQEYGCQAKFMGTGCAFRWRQGMASVLLECDHGYDTANGCRAHFPDVRDPVTGKMVPQPKPYGAFLGSVDHKLVRGG